MQWFLYAIGAPLLWAIVNIADQYLIAKYSDKEKERSSGGLVIFSSLIGLVIALGIFIFVPDVFNITMNDKLLLLLTGALTVAWIVLYLFTLEIEEVSKVVPWFLTIPVFGYILGYLFLGETLNSEQITGSIMIFIGLMVISINWSHGVKSFKRKPILYMLFASLFVAVSGIIFKYVTIENNFWISSFWEYLGLGLTGILIFLFMAKQRNEFMHMNRKGGAKIFLVNIFSEFMSVAGNLLTNFALLLAPVALVYVVGSFQPAILLILTILGTYFFPKIVKEDMGWQVLYPKIVALVIMAIGSAILFL
ncbi:MAG: DMT family transporter [Candidatus Pacebacteria bacterium]|nr:DMT family transporter [Candidatus Paceibacterota bacterium]